MTSTPESTGKDAYTIAVLGTAGVGKTILIHRNLSSQVFAELEETVQPTTGVGPVREASKAIYVGGKTVDVTFVDTPGALAEELVEGGDEGGDEGRDEELVAVLGSADGFVLAYACTSRVSFDVVPRLAEAIHRVRGSGGMLPPAMVVAALKCDLEDERVVSTRDGMDLADELGADFIEASAKAPFAARPSDSGIKYVMKTVVDRARQIRHPPPDSSWCTTM